MDKNNPEKQKVSKHAPVYLYRNKAIPRKTTFRKKHKLLPCSKPGPLHLKFNPKGQIIVTLNKRSPLYSGTGITVLLVLLFIWNYIWMYFLFRNAGATESKDLEKIFVLVFAAQEEIHSSVSWIIERIVRHWPCLNGLHELDCFNHQQQQRY